MPTIPRQSEFGFPQRQTRNKRFEELFAPTSGFTDQPAISAPPHSIVSGQNVWIKSGVLQPRDRLSIIGSGKLGGEPNGFFLYDSIEGGATGVVTSKDTVAYIENQSFNSLTYASGASNLPPSGEENDDFFGTSVYLPRSDINIAIFTNGVEPLFAWEGQSISTAFSTLTEGPIAIDITLFDNRPVVWNTRELSSTSRFVQRVQWPVAGDPEDWTGIGSGSEDLVDMRGVGTRIFSDEDEMFLATDKEIWRGRKVGLPFVFDFSSFNRTIGMPFRRAAIQTPRGIFWLNDDFNIYRIIGEQIQPVGDTIREVLRDELADFDTAFFGYNEQQGLLNFYYTSSVGTAPQRAWSLDILEGHWTKQIFTQPLSRSGSAIVSSSATTWGGLVDTLDDQVLTYDQFLGITGASDEAVFSSDGTGYTFSSTATNDDGSVVEENITFGVLFQGPQQNRFLESRNFKLLDEVKLDVSAPSASTLSIAGSFDLGETFPQERQISISASSTYTQAKVNFTLSGVNPNLRFRSDDGSRWQVARVYATAIQKGRSV